VADALLTLHQIDLKKGGKVGNELTETKAFENDLRIKQIKRSTQENFILLAKLLKENQDNKYYQLLDYKTFESYIASPELSFERRTVYSLIAIYEKYVEQFGVQPVALLEADYSKLDRTLKIVDQNNYEEWLEKAKTLSRSDLELEIKDALPKIITPPLPEGKYQVIYADPAWEYAQEQHSHEKQDTVLNTHYPTMPTEDIAKLPVKELAGDNSVLFLWTTSPKLYEAKQVVDGWGFEYKASMIWDKVKHNVGYYVSVRHEILLICTKGSCLPDNPKLYDSVVTEERTEHSKKPELFYQIIEDLYHGKKIELFARNKREGWDSWGNQL